MYGTVAHMRLKPGAEEAMQQLWEEGRRRQAGVKGIIGTYVFRKDDDPSEYVMVAVFEDKQSYVANADDPEQAKWFGRLIELLEGDPVWEDGEVVASS